MSMCDYNICQVHYSPKGGVIAVLKWLLGLMVHRLKLFLIKSM